MTDPRIGARLPECLRGFPAAALELSDDGQVLDSNGRLEMLLRREVVNRPFADFLDPTSQAKWQRLLADRSEETSGAIWELVLEGHESLELRSFAAIWGKESGEDILWLVEYARDLRLEPLYEELSAANSELIQVQRDLAKERARLSHALEAEQAARSEAERAVRIRDGVLAVVAHDLRNPIGRIATTVSLLLEESLAAPDRAKLLAMLRRTTAGMSRLVQDLVDVASLEAGRLAIDREPLDPRQLVIDVCDAFRASAAERGLRLVCDSGTGVQIVAADRGRIVQVLNNLLDNAMRLTPAGGELVVRAELVEGSARLTVSDTGPGIEPEELPHLFDRFWQGQRSRRGSAGLGLAKGIIEAHGGRIGVESTPGHGSTFYIFLPGTDNR